MILKGSYSSLTVNMTREITHSSGYSNMRRLMERLYANYYQTAIQPITGEKVTFFLPSEKALQAIPAGELDRVSDANLANVSGVSTAMGARNDQSHIFPHLLMCNLEYLALLWLVEKNLLDF